MKSPSESQGVSMKPNRNRWVAFTIFFLFMLLHQMDKLLIGPLTTAIMNEFHITKTQMGAVFTGALVVGAIAYPLWGYLYDKYARAKLLALASAIWGATTWISAIAPTFPLFLASRASTGIDDSSYPGLYSLMADYFPPSTRGKIYGLLQLTSPIGYLLGMLLALLLGGVIGWRNIFYITGSLGLVLAVVIFFSVKDAPRGKSEPEFAGLEQIGVYKFDWKIARDLLKKKSLWLIFIQGFFGVFPWNVITYWFFAYLETERHYDQGQIMFTMVFAVLILASGYPLGGAVGDYFFKRSPRGRLWVGTVGVLVGAVLMTITMNIPIESTVLFAIMLALTAIFIPIAGPNVISTVYDITLPEVRSTAYAIESFIESIGAATAPLIAGIIADQSSLKNAILIISVSTWLLCALFFAIAIRYVPADVASLRKQMQERADNEKFQLAIIK
jgi:MFS transporter, Spinster family, sphingosine-1-phosphate transporter